jgi:cell fate (sporulation/competence/biofilm development) regulator YlbF (YheA/YmcA/DUF963 family)
MREETYLSLMNLKELLKNDSRIISLNEIEKEMENNSEVQLLAYKKDMLVNEYNDMLRLFKDDSEEVKKARYNLYLAKRELESHEVVREYFKKYSVVRNLLEVIEELIFEGLETRLCK